MTDNLQRIPAKIFAENAPQNVVGQFGSALNGTKVNTTDVNIIQGLSAYTTGWSSAVISNRNYPTLEEMNGVMKTMSYQTAYNMQKGVAEWDSQTTYYTGDICKAIGSGTLYVSRSDNNIGNPVSNTTYWQEYSGAETNIPATNYIYSLEGNANYNNLNVNLPDMTLYIPNGRSGNNSVNNTIVNVQANTYNVSGNGEYTLFYNNATQNLHLAPNYTVRVEEFPEGANYNDVCYKLDNKMYVVETTNPNYSAGSGVVVSDAGIVSGLGSLSLIFNGSIPLQPVLDLDFTTGNDVTTPQDLFSTPYAIGTVNNGALIIDLYSLAYTVNYFPQVYSGAYTLQSQTVTYRYTFNNTDYYTNGNIQVGSNLYTDEELTILYGTVTNLQNNSIVVSDIQTVYDGTFTQISSGSYYTYDFGGTNYYTLSPLSNGVTVYTDTAMSDIFGVVTSVTGSTVLIQNTTQLYSGAYDDVTTSVYTYLLTSGPVYIYSAGVLIPGLTVYSDNTLTTAYGVVETITTSNVVIHSQNDSAGYVAQAGSGSVASGISIYSDVNLQTLVATSTGANSTYTGSSAKSKVGTINYNVSANTQYSGSLEYNGTSYNLVLNGVSSSFITSRNPYVDNQPAISFGGANGFDGTIDISNMNMPNVWTWNGHNTITPDWNVEPLCELGKITIENGAISDLKINYPIELVKFSDLEHLNLPQGSGSGYQLFDIVMKDHVLTDEESLGFAAPGTYVYKEAIAGSRYGYPDFYAKCIAEYNNSSTISQYLSSNINIVGSLTDNNGVLSGFSTSDYATLPEAFNPENNNWEMQFKFTTPSDWSSVGTLFRSNGFILQNSANSGRINIYLTSQGSETDYDISNANTSSGAELLTSTTYWFKLKFTGSAYIAEISTNGETFTEYDRATSSLFIQSSSQSRLGLSISEYPWKGSIDCNQCYININGQRLWTGINLLNYKTNSNGHRFYDIADKATFDNIFGITGECWYYGIDTTNERIFMPRSTRFKNGTTSDVGGYQAPGLPNIEGEANFTSSGGLIKTSSGGSASGAFTEGTSYSSGASGAGGASTAIRLDASLSNSIYGNSTTVEYSSTKLIPYIVVGNVANVSSAIDVVDITTTENDTLPLFTGLYFDYAPNNASWVIAGGQVVSGTIYEFAYNELVNELTTPKYNLNVIDVNDMVVGTDYSTYWKVDQTNQTFTCPIRTSERVLVAKKEATALDPTWYNLYSDGWCEQGGDTEPGTNSYQTTNLIIPYKNSDYVLLLTDKTSTGNAVYSRGLPIDNSSFTYYRCSWPQYWVAKGYCAIPTISDYTEPLRMYFKVANAVQNLELLDAGEVLEAVNTVSAKIDNAIHIIDTYENGTSGYIIWSNGYCEQWGHFSGYTDNASHTVSLLKTYKDTNYNAQISYSTTSSNSYASSAGAQYCSIFNKTTSSFKAYSYTVATLTNKDWITRGYLAEGQY